MKKYCIITTVIVIIALLLMAVFIPETGAQSGNSQEFSPSRYVVLSAEIDVDSLQMGESRDPRKVIVRMDTVSGKTWVMQLGVTGGNDPKIRSSSWHEIGTRPKDQF